MNQNKSSRGREQFSKYEKLINILVKITAILPKSLRKKLFEGFRNKKGVSGIAIRYILLKTLSKKIGNNVSIQPSVFIFSPENLEIGDNVSIHPLCYIDATGGISIGDDVSIAHGATIMSSTHLYNNLDVPIKDQGIEVNTTKILDNVWVGSKATILDGITVSSGNVIAASAVVTKSTKENAVMAGIPAKVIKFRE